MSLQARATDVIDRLDDCGNGAGVVESDLLGNSARQPFRRACQTLADQLLHISGAFSDASKVASAVGFVRQAAGSERCARDNLDAALSGLLNALDPSEKTSVRLEVMERLTSFLQSARLLEFKKEKERKRKLAENGAHTKNLVGPADEDPLAVSDALRALGAVAGAKKGEHEKAVDLLTLVESFVGTLTSKLPRDFFSPVIKSGSLDGEQMDTLGEIHEHLTKQYTMQRRVLIERAVVTLQSFLWSKRLEEKGTVKEVEKIVADGRAAMLPSPQVSVSSLFTTTYGDVAAVAQKATSGSEGKFEASVKSVIIGKVPDRGGRPEGRAAEAYAANMPAFSSRSTADQHRDGGAADFRTGEEAVEEDSMMGDEVVEADFMMGGEVVEVDSMTGDEEVEADFMMVVVVGAADSMMEVVVVRVDFMMEVGVGMVDFMMEVGVGMVDFMMEVGVGMVDFMMGEGGAGGGGFTMVDMVVEGVVVVSIMVVGEGVADNKVAEGVGCKGAGEGVGTGAGVGVDGVTEFDGVPVTFNAKSWMLDRYNNTAAQNDAKKVKYEETIGDIKERAAAKLGVSVQNQQLFWHRKELTEPYDSKTLLEMNMHTGFSLRGYDLAEEPDYWPGVEKTPNGLVEVVD
ncbi:LOW QUALITY PROTEIN: hypothetical protein BSKO_03970 [Bryopsis sp. KO-2023]|nr:LOW QUALITY PROTEIN: hypothetical protein BSKO_03970 [Bryopsis sp. KO-2023]